MALAGSEKSYSKVFFVISQILVLLALYALYDEAVVRRPWKNYQEEFNRLEAQVARQDLATIEKEYKSNKTDEKIAKLKFDLEKAQIARESDDYKKLAKKQDGMQNDLDDLILDIKFKKSILDNYYYEWKHAFQSGHDYQAKEKRYRDLEVTIKELQAKLAVEQAKLDELTAKMNQYDQKIADLNKGIEALEQPLKEAAQKLANIGYRNIDIQQIVVADYGIQGNIYWGRVDRCQTCHTAINKPGYENIVEAFKLKVVKDEAAVKEAVTKNPESRGFVVSEAQKKRYQVLYGTHPRHQELLGKHPVDQFGCTSCHGGDGRGLIIKGDPMGEGDKVHAFHHHAVEPLLRGKQIESNCLSCHGGEIALTGAQHLSKGLDLFVNLGCQGCHLVKGYDGIKKVGPELNKVASKVDANWLVDWIRNPKNYMPNSRMPHFNLKDDDVVAVASFLTANSKDHVIKNQNKLVGDVASGQKLFDTIGCRGCHAAEDDAKTYGQRSRAPNLSRVAAKIKSADWIYDWLKDPKNYSQHARMPSLRLTDKEASDITAFLMTKNPDYKDVISKRSGDLAQKVDGKNQDLITQGKQIMTKRGCYACHTIDGFEGLDRIGPELTAESLKEGFEFDFGDALKNKFVFTNEFGKKVLVTHHEETAGELSENFSKSENLPEGVTEKTNLTEMWQSWIRNKLKYPQTIYQHPRAELKMPSFNLSDEELDDLLVFLKGLQNRDIPAKYNATGSEYAKQVIAGQRIVAENNCMGCHAINNIGGDIVDDLQKIHGEGKTQFYPPSLEHVGEKIRPEWLYDFLKNPKPYRPAVSVRMPTFNFTEKDINTLIQYFAGMSRMNTSLTQAHYELDAELISVGKALSGPEAFNCFSCHLQNGTKPGDDPTNWAPDWVDMSSRLQYDFIARWIRNPSLFQKYAVMPAFLTKDDEAHPDYLGGKAELQINALREYILSFDPNNNVGAR